MDILFTEAKYDLNSDEIKQLVIKKEKLDRLAISITAQLKLIHDLSMLTKTSYVQKALKYKK